MISDGEGIVAPDGEELAAIVKNEIDRVWDVYNLERLLTDARQLSAALRQLFLWDGASVLGPAAFERPSEQT